MGSKKEFVKYQKYVNKLINKKNKVDTRFYNGVFNRYVNPIVTAEHVPFSWRYDLNEATNPYYIERLGINGTFNCGAIYFDGYYQLVVRVEGTDRKSFFAVAKSKSPIDGFKFSHLVIYDDIDEEETNAYDMRLVKHQYHHRLLSVKT